MVKYSAALRTDQSRLFVGRNNVRSSASGDTEATLIVGGDDSDYYTPEDAPTTVLNPLHADKV